MHPDYTPNIDNYQELIKSHFDRLEQSQDRETKGSLRSVADKFVGTVQKVRLSRALNAAATDLLNTAERAAQLDSLEDVRALSRLTEKAHHLAAGASSRADELNDTELSAACYELTAAVNQLSKRLISSRKLAADRLGPQLKALERAVSELEASKESPERIQRAERRLRSAEHMRRWVSAACEDPHLRADFRPRLEQLSTLIERLERLTPKGQLEQTLRPGHKLRGTIDAARERAALALESGMSGRQVSHRLSQDIRDAISELYTDAVKAVELKRGPAPCQFCLVFSGSLARREAGPYPDLDNLILLPDLGSFDANADAQSFYQAVNQFAADHIVRLGESASHGKPGIRLCSGGMNPIYQVYGWRYSIAAQESGKALDERSSIRAHISERVKDLEKKLPNTVPDDPDPSVRRQLTELQVLTGQAKALAGRKRGGQDLFLSTVTPLATVMGGLPKASDPLKFKLIRGLVDLDASMSCGDASLLAELKAQLQQRFQGREDAVLKARLAHAHACCDSSGMVSAGTFPRETFDVKKDFYRVPQVVVSDLALRHDVVALNSFERLQALKQQGVLSEPCATQMERLLDLSLKLRVRSQLAHGKEKESMGLGSGALPRAEAWLAQQRERLLPMLEDIDVARQVADGFVQIQEDGWDIGDRDTLSDALALIQQHIPKKHDDIALQRLSNRARQLSNGLSGQDEHLVLQGQARIVLAFATWLERKLAQDMNRAERRIKSLTEGPCVLQPEEFEAMLSGGLLTLQKQLYQAMGDAADAEDPSAVFTQIQL